MQRILLLLLGLASCQPAPPSALETGVWEGIIAIGPLCPVEPCRLTDAQRDTLYRAYRLPLLHEGSTQATTYLQPTDRNGRFSLTLPAGQYAIRCDQCPGQQVGTVSIRAGQTTRQDVSVDTGIR